MRVIGLLGTAAIAVFMGSVGLFDVGGLMTRARASEAEWWSRGRIRRRVNPHGPERYRTVDRIAGAFLLVLAVVIVAGVLFAHPR